MNVLYYPGCSLDGTAREYGESVEAVFKTLGIELQELPDWSCCGSSSAHVSNDKLSISLAARNLHIAEKIGLDMVVPCAACYQRLKVAEKILKEGEKVEGISTAYEGKSAIKHVADFLWEYAGESAIHSRVKKPLNGLKPVCYYGCLTTRPPKVTDATRPEDPRSMDNIAGALGADVHNWSYKTDCCGGNMILTRPDIAHRLVQKLLDMAIEADANCIVVSCPMCFSNLDSPQKEISQATGKQYQVPIYYITELMGIAFGDAAAEKWLHRHITDPVPLLKQLGLL
jgi:heterodisulfide reductase subunit B